MARILYENKPITESMITSLLVGAKHELVLQLYNENPKPVVISDMSVNEKDITIIEYSKMLNAYETGKIVIEVNPPESRRTGYNTAFSFREHYN